MIHTRKKMSGGVSEEIALQWWNFRQIKIKYNYFIYWFSRKNYRYLSDITPKCLVIY